MEPADPATIDFTFDKSGDFMFGQVYCIGAAMQLDRYIEAERQLREQDNKVTRMFVVMHEISCLIEDLATLAVYMRNGNIQHPKHKLWKQARHHIRHDLRDPVTNEADAKKTKKRLRFLKIGSGLRSTITFKPEKFTIGDTEIFIDEISDYIDWANEVFGLYVDWSRKVGHLKDK